MLRSSRMRPAAPLRAALAAAALLAAPSPGRAGPAGTHLFRHDSFTVSLPAGWTVADERPGPKGRRYVPARRPQAAAHERVVRFADARGNYFIVHVDRAIDLDVDAVWTVHATSDGASVRIAAEGEPCRGGAGASGPCAAGDGMLEVGTLPALRLGAHSTSCTVAEETDVGGGLIFSAAWTIVTIWPAFTPTRSPTTTTSPTMTTTHGFRLDFMLVAHVPRARGAPAPRLTRPDGGAPQRSWRAPARESDATESR